MAYNSYFPTGYQQPYYQPQMQQPQNQGVVWVQGIEGAKAHPIAAGQAVLLMDSDADCMYLKSADATGMPSLRIFDYVERTNAPQKATGADMSDFLTKEDILPYATKDDLKTALSALKDEITSELKVRG